LRTFVTALAIIAFLGWNQALPAATTGPQHANVARREAPHLTDAQIEGVIKAKLARSKMVSSGFTIHVHNGIATWEGKTDVIQRKGAATRMARTAGAVQVVNNIKIGEEARRKAAERLAKARNGGQPVKKASLVQ
jgi:hypothetical protein